MSYPAIEDNQADVSFIPPQLGRGVGWKGEKLYGNNNLKNVKKKIADVSWCIAKWTHFSPGLNGSPVENIS